MPQPEVDDALLVRPSGRAQLPSLALLSLFLCAYLVLGATGVIRAWLVISGVLVFGVVLVIGLCVALKARKSPWERRLEDAGLTVRGHPRLPWSDLAEVRVSRLGLGPCWLSWLSLGYRVAAFIGRPGCSRRTMRPVSLRGRRRTWSQQPRERRLSRT